MATMTPSPRKATTVSPVIALVVAFVSSVTGGCQPSSQPAHGSFVLDGKPIHPLSLAPILGDLASEQPVLAAVDLEGSRQSGSHQSKISVRDGTVTAHDHNGGWVAYRHFGTTPSGNHVLITMVSGGGSGVFEDVVWLKLVRDQVSEDGKKRNRTMLVKIGSFTLGDRDDGEVTLDGKKLLIRKSRYREQDTMITLE
jgi:hypothetical protein